MTWAGFNPKTVPIKTLEEIGGAVEAVAGTVTGALEAVSTVLETVSKLLVAVPDPNTVVLQTAIDAVRAILADIVGGAGCYFLPIPIRFSSILEPETLLFDPTPGGAEVATAADLLAPPVGGGDGGNYGFLKDIIDSLSDVDDLLRPQFDEDAHVTGLVVLAGADSYLQLVDLVDQLRKLFSGTRNAGTGEGMATHTLPRPQALTAEVVGAAVGAPTLLKNRIFGDTTTHPYGIRLEWPTDEAVTVIGSLGSDETQRLVFTIRNVVVYRSETLIDPAMDADELAALQLASFEYDGVTSTFFDDTIQLNTRYYYAIGYEVEALLKQGQETLDAKVFPPTRDVAITYLDIPSIINTLPRSGAPPDWIVLPGPAALIPDIEEAVASVNLFLDSLEKRGDAASDKFQEYLDLLNTEIQRYNTIVQQTIRLINRIVSLLTFPDVYIGAYTFSGKGGNSFFVSSLGNSLNDASDTDRPPFDRGDEVVTGFVLYAGSATAGKLTAFSSGIDLLLTTQAAGYANIYSEAATQLGIVLEQVERDICFLDDLTKADNCEDTADPNTTLGDDMDPGDEDPACVED